MVEKWSKKLLEEFKSPLSFGTQLEDLKGLKTIYMYISSEVCLNNPEQFRIIVSQKNYQRFRKEGKWKWYNNPPSLTRY